MSAAENIKATLQGSGRTLYAVGAVVVLAAAGGAYVLMNASKSGPEAQGNLKSAPQTSHTATGVGGTEEYNRLIMERNRQVAQEAATKGTSAIPILTEQPTCVESEELKDRLRKMEMELAKLQGEYAAIMREKAELERKLAEAMRRQQVRSSGSNEQAHSYNRWRDAQKQEYLSKSAWQTEQTTVKDEMTKLKAMMGNGPATGMLVLAEDQRDKGKQESTHAGTCKNPPCNTGQTEDTALQGTVVLKPGEVLYATLDTAMNSDIPGPVLATVQSGRFKGARLIGGFKLHDEFMVVEFTHGTLPDGRTVELQGFAVDPSTALPGVGDDVDHHYLLRFGAIAGAAFLQGYGRALAMARTRTEYIDLPNREVGTTLVPIQRSTMNDKDIALSALGDVGQALGEILKKAADRPPTVQKYAGSDVGILVVKPGITK